MQAPSTSDVTTSPRLCGVSSSAAFEGQIPAGFEAWLGGQRSLHLIKEHAKEDRFFPNDKHRVDLPTLTQKTAPSHA